MRMLTDKKGLTPVVATIILCGVVLIVGTSVWAFTYSISSGLQTDYLEGVEEQMDAISERFTVEHVAYDNDTKTLHVWVHNYGNVSVNVDVYAFEAGAIIGSNTELTSVSSGVFAEITISLGDYLSPGSELVIEVISRRQNVVYETYVVPAA